MLKYFLIIFFVFINTSGLQSKKICLSFYCLENSGELRLVISQGEDLNEITVNDIKYNSIYKLTFHLDSSFIQPEVYQLICMPKLCPDQPHPKLFFKKDSKFRVKSKSWQSLKCKKFKSFYKTPFFKSLLFVVISSYSIAITLFHFHGYKIKNKFKNESGLGKAIFIIGGVCFALICFAFQTVLAAYLHPFFANCCFSKKPYKEKELFNHFNTKIKSNKSNQYITACNNKINGAVVINFDEFFDYVNETTFYKGLNKIFPPEICNYIFLFNDGFGEICWQTPQDAANLFKLGLEKLLENQDPIFKKQFLKMINQNLKELNLP